MATRTGKVRQLQNAEVGFRIMHIGELPAMEGLRESIMAKRYTLRLLAAAIISIGLYSASAFAATPGTWVGTGEFGTFELVVNAAGTGIEKFTLKFSAFTCGISTTSLTLERNALDNPWPINNDEFSIFSEVGSNETMTVSGTFKSATQASGTWKAVFYDEECTGTWTSGETTQDSTLVINGYLSGSWYNASQSGHGFSIEVVDEDTTIVYWYMYSPTGHSMFLFGSGRNEGNRVIVETYVYQGMKWGEFDNTDLEKIYWGEMTLEFHDCDTATLTYSSVVAYGDESFGSGTIPLTRLLYIDQMQCNNNIHAGIYESTFRSDLTGELHLGTTLLTSDGEFVMFSFRDTVAFGTYTISGQNFAASGTALSADPDVYFSSGISATGQVLAGHRLNFDYDISGGDSGSGNGWFASSLYRRGISFASISGDWNTEALIFGEKGSANISSTGRVTGSDDEGCTYSGQITIPNTRFNMIEITVTIANCGDGNGTYTGFGYQTDAFDLGDGGVLRVFVGDNVGTSVVDLWR